MQRKAIVLGVLVVAIVWAVQILPAVMGRPQGLTVWTPPGAPTRTPLATYTPRKPVATPAPTATATPEQHSVITTTTRGVAAAILPTDINGVALDKIIAIPEATRQNIHSIYERGASLGRDTRAFAKVGDSTMVWPVFLATFDNPQGYRLGAYADLQETIAYYAGSFGRESLAVQKGMHTWTEFDVTLANQGLCKSGEGPLACELRVQNPSVAIIRLGTNDALEPAGFEKSMRSIVEYCIANGVIPVLGTKPDRVEGQGNTINKIIYKLADIYKVPVWDYDLLVATVPGKGLQADGMHFVPEGSHNYASAATFQYAYSIEDLSALIVLDTLRRELQ